MGWIAWIVLGGFAGWIASMLTKNNGQMGIISNIVVGILGAFAGSFVFQQFGGVGLTGFNFYSLMVSVVGAVILLWVFNLIQGRR